MQIMVHQLKPPFLTGKVEFSAQQEMVSTVKDPTSDMATCARNGSAVLQQHRARRLRVRSEVGRHEEDFRLLHREHPDEQDADAKEA